MRIRARKRQAEPKSITESIVDVISEYRDAGYSMVCIVSMLNRLDEYAGYVEYAVAVWVRRYGKKTPIQSNADELEDSKDQRSKIRASLLEERYMSRNKAPIRFKLKKRVL